MLTRIERAVSSLISWFFGLNGSIEGGTIRLRPWSQHSGMYCSRVKTVTGTFSRYGARKSHPSSTSGPGSSFPTWQRQITIAPCAIKCGARPAVCGSCRTTTSPGPITSFRIAAFSCDTASYTARCESPRSLPSPREPCSAWCSRFVIRKNSWLPSITAQRVSMPRPRAYGIRLCSISATPPPCAVEFTFQNSRPCSMLLAASAFAFSSATGSSPTSGISRSIDWLTIGTWCSLGMLSIIITRFVCVTFSI